MSDRFISWVIFVALCFIWGSSFILMRYSKDDLTASQIAALRIFAAGVVFLPFAVFHIRKLPARKLGLVICAGIFGNLLPAFLFAIAIAKNIDSSLAGILNSLTPVCVVVIGIVFFRDKVGSQKLWGVLVGLLGLILLTLLPVFLDQKNISLDNFGYSMLLVLATLFYGINVNLFSHYMKGSNAVHVASVSLAFMIIPSAAVLWWEGFWQLDFSNRQVQNAVFASVVLGIFGSAIATAIFYLLVQKAGAIFASLVTYGIPFVALFWGFIYEEKITWIQIACLCIILFGVYLANKPEKPR